MSDDCEACGSECDTECVFCGYFVCADCLSKHRAQCSAGGAMTNVEDI